MVYFAARPDGTIKIGTTIRIKERLLNIQQKWGRQVRIIAAIRGGFTEERQLHRRFRHLHTKCGEWFNPGEDLMEFIRTHGMSCEGIEYDFPAG